MDAGAAVGAAIYTARSAAAGWPWRCGLLQVLLLLLPLQLVLGKVMLLKEELPLLQRSRALLSPPTPLRAQMLLPPQPSSCPSAIP